MEIKLVPWHTSIVTGATQIRGPLTQTETMHGLRGTHELDRKYSWRLTDQTHAFTLHYSLGADVLLC